MITASLVVNRIDLDPAVLAAAGLDDLAWSSIDGRVMVTVSADDICDQLVTTARRIRAALPDASIVRVDEDLVGTSDIARRIGVSKGFIRMCAIGERGDGHFPTPMGTVGGSGHGTRVWPWRWVREWLVHSHKMQLDPTLTDDNVTAVNAMLAMDEFDHLLNHSSLGSPAARHIQARGANMIRRRKDET